MKRTSFRAMAGVAYLGLLMSSLLGYAQPATSETDPDTRTAYRELMIWAEGQDLSELAPADIMMRLAEHHLGRPYLAGPLDGFGREVVVARLDAFDCFTFVEAMMAAARGIAQGDTTFAGYMKRTEEQRYRDGSADTYCDRLHYFTEWVHVNEERGLVEDVTARVGGRAFPKQYGFMTANREAYAALADNDDALACISDVEKRLNSEIRLHFIPQDRIAEHYDRLENGDIIATVTDIEGLDVTHTGFVYKGQDGSTGLLHASTTGSVIISPDLQRYVQGVRVTKGIVVSRLR